MKKSFILIALTLFCFAAQARVFYQKVTTDLTDWTGEYLIVKEVDSIQTAIVFDGSLTDLLNKKNNTFRVPVIDAAVDEIASDKKTDAATFTIARQADGTYTVRSHSGYYIGTEQADSASLTTKKSTPFYHHIRFESDTTTKVLIESLNGGVLRYNADPESNRFRFYAPGKKKAIHLYKRVDTTDLEDAKPTDQPLIDGRLYSLPAGIYIQGGELIFKKD